MMCINLCFADDMDMIYFAYFHGDYLHNFYGNFSKSLANITFSFEQERKWEISSKFDARMVIFYTLSGDYTHFGSFFPHF